MSVAQIVQGVAPHLHAALPLCAQPVHQCYRQTTRIWPATVYLYYNRWPTNNTLLLYNSASFFNYNNTFTNQPTHMDFYYEQPFII